MRRLALAARVRLAFYIAVYVWITSYVESCCPKLVSDFPGVSRMCAVARGTNTRAPQRWRALQRTVHSTVQTRSTTVRKLAYWSERRWPVPVVSCHIMIDVGILQDSINTIVSL